VKYKLAIIISGILIGLIGVLVKSIGDSMNGVSITFFRMLIALIAITIFIPFIDKKTFQINKTEAKHFFLAGLIMAASFTLYSISLLLAPVSNIVLINSTNIIFVALFAYLILKEKITKNQKIAMPIALFGLFILNPIQGGFLTGSLVALVQAIIYALLVVILKREREHYSMGETFWLFLFATIILLPLAIYFGLGDVSSSLIPLITLGVLSTAIAYFLLAYGLKNVAAETAAIMTVTSIVLSSIFFAVIFIGEIISITTIIGGLFLLTAGIVASYKTQVKKHYSQ
tara:strand:+ start:2250 stop:3107 length:858 start_codon:yes stop_codon:yes gene_type:complete